MDEDLRETTELPESGGTAPSEENEPETKSIRFAPSAYDPRGIEQWLSERAAEGKLLLRYLGDLLDVAFGGDRQIQFVDARFQTIYILLNTDIFQVYFRADRVAGHDAHHHEEDERHR